MTPTVIGFDPNPGNTRLSTSRAFFDRIRQRRSRAYELRELRSTIAARAEAAGIPQHFAAASFGSADQHTPEEPKVSLRGWARDPAGCVLLYGPVGAGKSFLAVAVLRAWLRRHRGGRFVSVADLFRRLQEGMARRGAGWTAGDVQDLVDAPLLVLDDLGTEHGSEWARSILLGLIDGRYSNDRPTLITTNLNLQRLAAVVDDRTASRLAEGRIIKLDGSDRRLQTKNRRGEI